MIFDRLLTHPTEVLNIVHDSIESKSQLLLTYFNQHCFNIYNQNDVYKKLVDFKFKIFQADLGVFFALKIFGKKNISRIDATEMNQLVLEEIIKSNTAITIVGGNFDEESLFNETRKKGIKLIKYLHGYFDNSQTENIIQEINKFNTQVILIGMGVPLQEMFAEKLAVSSPNKIIICVGSFFEFYFGTKKRTHIFLRKIGLEWLYRLLTEPTRLWKRYLIGIPLFIYGILKIKFAQKPVSQFN